MLWVRAPVVSSLPMPDRINIVVPLFDGVTTAIRAGFAVVVPAGANHNIINTSRSKVEGWLGGVGAS